MLLPVESQALISSCIILFTSKHDGRWNADRAQQPSFLFSKKSILVGRQPECHYECTAFNACCALGEFGGLVEKNLGALLAMLVGNAFTSQVAGRQTFSYKHLPVIFRSLRLKREEMFPPNKLRNVWLHFHVVFLLCLFVHCNLSAIFPFAIACSGNISLLNLNASVVICLGVCV